MTLPTRPEHPIPRPQKSGLVYCPSCADPIDLHPTDWDRHCKMGRCQCNWTINDIAYALVAS